MQSSMKELFATGYEQWTAGEQCNTPTRTQTLLPCSTRHDTWVSINPSAQAKHLLSQRRTFRSISQMAIYQPNSGSIVLSLGKYSGVEKQTKYCISVLLSYGILTKAWLMMATSIHNLPNTRGPADRPNLSFYSGFFSFVPEN